MQRNPSGHPPTLTDVANHAGVSLATASRVLGGSRDRVSPALARRVTEAAHALDYVPNAHARALSRASSTTIGLIVHDVGDPYFSEIARGVLRAASDLGHLVMICNSYRDPERELQYIAELRAQRVHAILMAGSGYTDQTAEERLAHELQAFRTAGGRVALIGRHHAAIDAVQPDNTGGAAKLAQFLIASGHQDIAVVAGPSSLTTIEDRLAGFREVLAQHDLALPGRRVQHGDFSRTGGYDSTLALLDDDVEFSALFALNDAMAVGALAALRERSIAVPERVSVAGFDDIPLAADVTPALTTIRIPMADMGTSAVELAVAGDADPAVGDGSPHTIHASSELVVRGSVARLA